MKYIASIIISIFFFNLLQAQGLNEELGFVFVKGEYLMETERYDDAISEFNKIIQENPQYKNVLLLRAKAKYILGAHLGVRNDVLSFIEHNGVTAEASRLLGLADFELKKYDTALNSLTIAATFFQDDVDVFNSRATIYYEKGMNIKACEDWNRAAQLGSSNAKRQLSKICGQDEVVVSKPTDKAPSKGRDRTIPKRPDREEVDEPKTTEPDDSTTASTDDIIIDKQGDNDNNESGMGGGADMDEEEPVEDKKPKVEEEYIDLDAVSEIYVDEDLTLVLKEGLGDRKILEQPNILILSDESGTVSIDVCVTAGGRIDSAKYNASNSTLNTKSIISLAVRKAKEFWFEKNRTPQVCGIIEFQVSGRE